MTTIVAQMINSGTNLGRLTRSVSDISVVNKRVQAHVGFRRCSWELATEDTEITEIRNCKLQIEKCELKNGGSVAVTATLCSLWQKHVAMNWFVV